MWPIRWLRIQSMMDNGQILMQTNGLDKHVVSVQSTVFLPYAISSVAVLVTGDPCHHDTDSTTVQKLAATNVNQYTYSTAYRLPYTRSQIRHSWADTTTFPMKLSSKLCSVLFLLNLSCVACRLVALCQNCRISPYPNFIFCGSTYCWRTLAVHVLQSSCCKACILTHQLQPQSTVRTLFAPVRMHLAG